MSDNEDIYEAPSEMAETKVSSVASLKRAFELKGFKPMQIDTDGRHIANDAPPVKPKPSMKPKFPPNDLPNLPEKKSQLRSIKLPPKTALKPPAANQAIPEVESTPEKCMVSSPNESINGGNEHVTDDVIPVEIPVLPQGRKSSSRSSIYPPTPESTKRRLVPGSISDENDNYKTNCEIPGYRKRPLPPPPDGGPPKKPDPVIIDLSPWTGEVDPDYDPDEIYDDIESPVFTSDTKATRESRPVSMIPDMSEDEELRDLEKKALTRTMGDVINEEDDQELYDDVGGDVEPEEAGDEIYQEI